MPTPKAPINVFTWKRRTHAVVKWDRVTQDVDLNPITVTKYTLYRTPKTNLHDYDLIFDIVTTDNDGFIDTAYLDMESFDDRLFFYQLKAFVGSDESALSAFAATLHFTDLRDAVGEPALDKFGRWDVSLWDDALYA